MRVVNHLKLILADLKTETSHLAINLVINRKLVEVIQSDDDANTKAFVEGIMGMRREPLIKIIQAYLDEFEEITVSEVINTSSVVFESMNVTYQHCGLDSQGVNWFKKLGSNNLITLNPELRVRRVF